MEISQSRYCQTCKIEDVPLMRIALVIRSNGDKLYRSMCRACNTARALKYRKTKVGAENIRKAVRKSTIKHKHKQDARIMLNRAVNSGLVVKEPCMVCSSRQAEAHHPDHSKPLEVVWVCRQHHADIHKTEFKYGYILIDV